MLAFLVDCFKDLEANQKATILETQAIESPRNALVVKNQVGEDTVESFSQAEPSQTEITTEIKNSW